MAKPQPELEFLLASDDDAIGDFIRHVANGGLTRYKSIIQWGGKAGEPLYAHVVNGVFVAETLRPLLHLTDEESRVLFSAFPVHDLNKLPDSAGKSFNRVTTLQAVQAELESVGVPDFFPDYASYLEDITLLVRSHPGHHHTSSEWLIPAHHPYTLSRERLDLLRDLMRALDILELSTTLEETTHKQSFLSFLNAHTATPFEFIYHKVHEQRGLLTNIIHNRVKDHLSDQFGFLPLLFYFDGTAYLRERNKESKNKIATQNIVAIGDAVAQSAASMTRGDFGKFITPTSQGIKVDVQCLELGIPFVDILGVIHSQVMAKVRGKRFAIGDKPGKDVETKCRSDLEKLRKDSSKKDLLQSIEQLLQRSRLMPQTQERMGAGELLLAHYVFLNKHFRHQIKDTWSHLYGLLGVATGQASLYAPLDPLYQRAYVIAEDLQLTVDDLLPMIQADGAKLIPGTQTESESLGDFELLRDYTARVVSFNVPAETSRDFGAALEQYVRNNHEQCCMCGSEFETAKLASNQVPDNVGVQSFSNRLFGGVAHEPRRYVCAICRIELILNKLNFTVGGKSKTIHLHLYPFSFFTEPFLVSLRAQLRDILNQDTSVLFPKTDEALRTYLDSEGKRVPLRFYMRNKQDKPYTNGLALPRNYAEAIGNVLTFPLNCPGKNDGEQFWFALLNALLIGRFFGCKVLVSDSAVPLLGKNEFGSLFVDNLPIAFTGVLPTNNLNYEALGALWDDVAGLFRLRSALYNPESDADLWLPLIHALNTEYRLELFHVVDRLIESKADNEGASLGLTRTCLPFVRLLISTKGEKHMKSLQIVAEMAWRDHIIGSSLKRNSLLKPFDMILDGLEAKSEAFGLDTLRAQLTEDIFRHIEAIADSDFKPGRTKREKVKAYVDVFFGDILAGVYHSNVTRLLNDVKPLRSAYLFYVREQIPNTPKEKKS